MVKVSSKANVHINKLEAARRQICAAVRMFFDGEDELAVHTVASAARSILGDLHRERGRDEAAYEYELMLYGMVVGYRRGSLPLFIRKDARTMARIRQTAEQLPMITASTTWEEFNSMVKSVDLSPSLMRKYWRERTRIANFLKHADHDAGHHLALSDIDNCAQLTHTIHAYQEVVPGSLLGEAFVLLLYSGAWAQDDERLTAWELELVAKARNLDDHERLAFGAKLLPLLKKDYANS